MMHSGQLYILLQRRCGGSFHLHHACFTTLCKMYLVVYFNFFQKQEMQKNILMLGTY